MYFSRHLKMQSVGGLLGVGGGAAGTSFAGPQGANITNPVTQAQINSAYTGNQNALTSQQQLLTALQGQNGLGNQSQVYGQLQGVANGTGPNPALATLNQATANNTANQAALMAGQRGAGANVGLIARQAAQQGAANQQAAAGQAATTQANQSLNAISAAGALANTQAQNQIGQTNANTQAQQTEQGNLINAQDAYNTAQTSSQGSVNAANAGMANTQLQGQQGVIGGIGQAGATAFGLADGGSVPDAPSPGPQSSWGKFLVGVSPGGAPTETPQMASSGPSAQTKSMQAGITAAGAPLANALKGGSTGGGGMAMAMMAGGGGVPIIVSPGERILSPKDVEMVKKGASPMSVGRTIPGKPTVGGAKNSYANDTVPMKAPGGSIVVPRSETKSKNPEKNSKNFVESVLAKRKVRK